MSVSVEPVEIPKIPNDHKVVVVLDHGPRFSKNSGSNIPISIKDQSTSELRQIAIAKKTLWSWSVESMLELHRVVSDLFCGQNRLMLVAVADSVGRMLQQEWGEELISHVVLAKAMSRVGAAIEGDDNASSSMCGLIIAVEALSQCTSLQKKWIDRHMEEAAAEAAAVAAGKSPKMKQRCSGPRVPGDTEVTVNEDGEEEPAQEEKTVPEVRPPNRGTIVLYTNFSSNEELIDLQNELSDLIDGRNKIIENLKDENLLFIDHVNLFIINTYPTGTTCPVATQPLTKVSSILSCSVVSRPAGEQLISATHSTTLDIYDLVSTTVSGIPMKEEAHQGQSVNYDVELLHPRTAHRQLEEIGMVGKEGFLRDVIGDNAYATYRLAWATPSPRNKWDLFPRTRCALRVTPAAVNSRPSVCLTSFLLAGRNVMLEVARKGPAEHLAPNVNQKLISHTLIAHGGRIYIHSVDIQRIEVLDRVDKVLTAVIDEIYEEEPEVVNISESSSSSSDDTEPEAEKMEVDADVDNKVVASSTESESVSESDSDGDDEGEENDDDAVDDDDEDSDDDESDTTETESSSDSDESITSSSDEEESTAGEGEKSLTAEQIKAKLRVPDFCKLIKDCSLRPPPAEVEANDAAISNIPCGQPIRQLLRLTRYWPLSLDDSVIYHIQSRFEPLLTLIRQPELSTDDVDKCKQVIYQLVGLKGSAEPLITEPVVTKKLIDPQNREEQYRVAISELASHLGNYVNHSERHLEVFNLYMQTTGIDRSMNIPVTDVVVPTDDSVPSQSEPSSARETAAPSPQPALDYNSRSAVASRSNSPLPKKARKALHQWKPNESVSIYDLLYGAEQRRAVSEWKDFVGRVEAGNRPAQLYKSLDLSTAPGKGEVQ